jgi:hypothetical protein
MKQLEYFSISNKIYNSKYKDIDEKKYNSIRQSERFVLITY